MCGFIRFFLFSIFILGSMVANSQSKEELQKKKQKLTEEISFKNSLLKKTEENKKSSLNELVILKTQINQRQDLIKTINNEIILLQQEIEETQGLIASMEDDLQNLKDEYAQMIYYANKNKDAFTKIMFIFSSKDFNQAYKRMKYMQQYTEYRKNQVALIKETQEVLSFKAIDLKLQKEEKSKLLTDKNKEKENLATEKQLQQNVYSELKSQESQLRAEIVKNKKEQIKLQNAIKKIIEEEIRKQKEAAKGRNPFTLTPEALELSNKFESNKGKLPWPVQKGVITQRFGENPHPVLNGIKIQNNGIDISTESDAKARAVFAGKVTSIIVIEGSGIAVMVRHGEYLTIYTNLHEVYVKKGEDVKLKESLGKINSSGDKTIFHFEVWKGQTTLDPSQWLYKSY